MSRSPGFILDCDLPAPRMDFSGCFLAHVPDHERVVAKDALPGAHLTGEPWDEDLVGAAADSRVLSVMIHDTVRPHDLERLPQLEAVVTRSDGHDHLPLEWMREHGIRGYHLEGYATQSVAQLALMMLIALARRVPEATRVTRSGAWDRDHLVGSHLGEMRVGVVGTGRIGGALVRLLDGMGVESVGYDIRKEHRLKDLKHHRSAESLQDLLASCQAVSLHVPLTQHTRGMIDADALAAMPEGSALVNTARGDVVDHDAVLHALRDGHLGGFAADVLPDEPQVPHLPAFAKRHDVLLTPHLGAHNHATIQRRYATLARVAHAVLEGTPQDVDAFRIA